MSKDGPRAAPALRPSLWWALLAALLLALAGCQTGEEAYPSRPVTLVVLDPAGGATDLLARQLVEAAKAEFPQPLVVLNRPGGAGTIAAAEVVRATPDGYTIGLQAVGPMALQPHRNQLPYGGVDDYAPIIKLAHQPLVWAARAEAPWAGPAELLAAAKANPGSLRVGLPGAGTIAQLNVELLERQSGAKFTSVPFGSAGEAVLALLNGQVETIIVGPPTLVGQVAAGRARVLGAFEERRDPLFPQAPTLREVGYDITLGGYFFLIAPKGTPPTVVARLHDTFQRALGSESLRAWSPRAGLVLDYAGPDDLRRQLARDYQLFGELVAP